MGNMENCRLNASYSGNAPFPTETTHLHESLIDSLSDGVIYLDDMGVIRFLNRAAEELLQVNREFVVGKRIDMLPLRTPLYKVLSEYCRDEPVEISISGRVVRVNAAEMPLPDGAGFGEIVELHDVTREKSERRQREEFVAMMTHDLKSPLTVMMGYVQAIKHDMLDTVDPSVRSCIKEIDRSSYKLLGMIEDILDAYRLEVGLLQIHREFCDMKDILQGCCRDISQEAQVRGIEFTYDISDQIPPMKIDGKQLGRVFANLIGNALKFTPRRGKVSVTAEMGDDSVLVSVLDTGIGIPEKDLPRIFNKYYRSESAVGFKGTGLGLTITKAIVDAHKGTIEVESKEGGGSRFDVTLPTTLSEW